MKTDVCKACSAPIIFCVTDKGARAPINADPDPTALVGFVLREDTGGPHATFVRRANIPADRFVHTSHFATCPEAGRFRRRS